MRFAIRRVGRKVSRFRWLLKVRLVSTWPRESIFAQIRFILLDPDINTYTYLLSNPEEVSGGILELLGAETHEVPEFWQELLTDKSLRRRLARRTRFRLEAKCHPPLGRHLASYTAVRVMKPKLVVECGVKHGLGSLIILRALERNEVEGFSGRLISIDPDPDAGWMVDNEAKRNWTLVRGLSHEMLPECAQGQGIEILISDSVPDQHVVEHEVESAMGSGDSQLLILANHHWTDVVRLRALREAAPTQLIRERTSSHPYPGRLLDAALFRPHAEP